MHAIGVAFVSRGVVSLRYRVGLPATINLVYARIRVVVVAGKGNQSF